MRATKSIVELTNRALGDISEIEAHSISQWGKRITAKYIADVEAALVRLQEKPDLLREHQDFPPGLRFYRVNKHILVCDVRPQIVCVLTVIHASRDIPTHLGELEPTLAAEAELLHMKLDRTGKR